MEVEMLSAVAASSTLSFARTPAGAGVQVLAAVHAYTTAVLVSGSIFVVGAVLTGVLLPSGVLRQPTAHSTAPHPEGNNRRSLSAPSRQRCI